MRFIQFLTEAAPQQKPPQQGDWIKKNEKADRQRARRATQKRGDVNKQNMQAKAQQPPGAVARAGQPVNTGLPQRPASEMPTVDFNTGKDVKKPAENPSGLEQRSAPTGPDSLNLVQLSPELIKHAEGSRQDAVEMITLLGAMYQAKRTNPEVEMSPPKIVTQSQNKDDLMKLYDIAKEMDLPQLAALSQEVKQHAAVPGQNKKAPAGTQDTPPTPGQTPAGKTMLQSLMDKIKQATKNLSPMDFSTLRKAVDKAARNAKPNPNPNPQQPIGKPVVTQG